MAFGFGINNRFAAGRIFNGSGGSYLPLTKALLDNGITANTTFLNGSNFYESKWSDNGRLFGMLAVELFLGASSTPCSWDWKRSASLGTFNNTWTFGANGVTGNGTNTSFTDGITGLDFPLNAGYVLTYCFVNNTTTGFDVGSNNNRIVSIHAYAGGTAPYGRMNGDTYNHPGNQGTSVGCQLVYRNSSGQHKLISVTGAVYTLSDPAVQTDNGLITLGTGVGGSTDRGYGLFIKGSESLSDADALELWQDAIDFNAIIHP